MRPLKISSVRRLLKPASRKQKAKRLTIVTDNNPAYWHECKSAITMTVWGADRKFRSRIERARGHRHD